LDVKLIYSNIPQQGQKASSNILNAILASGIKVKPLKYKFHQSETE